MLTAATLAEGLAAGTIRVSFTGSHAPRTYHVTITNGSGTKTADITATSQTFAAGWASGWATATGPGWGVREIHS